MRRIFFPLVLLVLVALPQSASAHCEVPCGIYADQMRFEMMLEDTATMEKAMNQISALAGKTDAQSLNQLTRWVNTKEDHATKTQHVIAQYFMAQRIKPGKDEASNTRYVTLLTKAHAVLQGAMKCKQTVDTANTAALKMAILSFHQAYAGK